MEEGEWSLQRLETFAAAYIQHEILYKKPSIITVKPFIRTLEPQHQELRREFALGRLAGALGLPNDHALDDRCYEFRRQLLCYIRGRVRTSVLHYEHPFLALGEAPTHISQLAKKLDLLWVAVQVELSCTGSPVRRWGLRALMQALSREVRLHCSVSGLEPESLTSDALAKASAAVSKNAKPVSEHIWSRLCELRKKQLLKLSFAGDRSEVLWQSERFSRADWELLDALVTYAPDAGMRLVTEVSLYGLESLRALVLLVELLKAACSRQPRSRACIWKTVHARYVGTKRSASMVLLQRRWQQLLQLVRQTPHLQHPLLVLVAASFPQVIRKNTNPWCKLVQDGLVATDEDVTSALGPDELTIEVDFTELESFKSTIDIELYLEKRLLRVHNIYYDGVLWKEKNNTNTVMTDSVELSNSKPHNDCTKLQSASDMHSSGSPATNNPNLESTIQSSCTITIDSEDDDVEEVIDVEECGKVPPEGIEADSQNYVEIEIDTSKIVDYVSDVIIEVDNLQTHDLGECAEDLDHLKILKITRLGKTRSQSNTNFIKYVDRTGATQHITISNTGRLIFNLASATLEPKLVSMPRVKLKRITETLAWRKHARHNRIDVKRFGTLETNDSNNGLRVQDYQFNKSDRTTFDYDSSSDNETEDDVIIKYIYDETSRNPDLNPTLKGLLKRFWNKPNNQTLMNLCKPVVVRLSRLQESEMPGRGRVVKRVELANIDEVRRVNKNILTAQVEPISVHNYYNKATNTKKHEELERQARKQAKELLASEIKALDSELKKLFVMPPGVLKDMINTSIYDDEFDKKDARKKYSSRYKKWLNSKRADDCTAQAAAPGDEQRAFDEWDQQKTKAKKYFTLGTKNADTKLDGDLDDLLRCTIIKKPTAEDSNTLETDIATQPFFVTSNEKLVASDANVTPVITGVCSLAENDPRVPAAVLSTHPITILSIILTSNLPTISTKTLASSLTTMTSPNTTTTSWPNPSTMSSTNPTTSPSTNPTTRMASTQTPILSIKLPTAQSTKETCTLSTVTGTNVLTTASTPLSANVTTTLTTDRATSMSPNHTKQHTTNFSTNSTSLLRKKPIPILPKLFSQSPKTVDLTTAKLTNNLSITPIGKPSTKPTTNLSIKPTTTVSITPVGNPLNKPITKMSILRMANPSNKPTTNLAAKPARILSMKPTIKPKLPHTLSTQLAIKPKLTTSLSSNQMNFSTTNRNGPDPIAVVKRIDNPRQYINSNQKKTLTPHNLVATAMKLDGVQPDLRAVEPYENGQRTHPMMVMPRIFAFRNDNNQNDTTPVSSNTSLPKQYERFGDGRTDFASLTPVIVNNANSSTITHGSTPHAHTLTDTVVSIVPTDTPLMSANVPQVMPSQSNTLRLIPTVTMTTPLTSQMLVTNTPQVAPTFDITSQMTSQMLLTNTPQVVPTFHIPSPIKPQMSLTNTSQVVPMFTMTTSMTSHMSVTITPQVVPTYNITTPTSSQISMASTPQIVPTFTLPTPVTSQMSMTNTLHVAPTSNIRKGMISQMPVTNMPEVVPTYNIMTPTSSQISIANTPQIVTTFTLPTPMSSQMSVTNTPHIVPTYNIRKGMISQMPVTNMPEVVPTYNITTPTSPQISIANTPQIVTTFTLATPMTSRMSVTNTPHIVPTYNIRKGLISQMPVTNMPEVVPSYNITAPMTSQMSVTKTPYSVSTNTITKISQMSITNTPDVVSTYNITTPTSSQISMANTPQIVTTFTLPTPKTSQMSVTNTPHIVPTYNIRKGMISQMPVTNMPEVVPSYNITAPMTSQMSVTKTPYSVSTNTITKISQMLVTNTPDVVSTYNITTPTSSQISMANTPQIVTTFTLPTPMTSQMSMTNRPQVVPTFHIPYPVVPTFTISTPMISQMSVTNTPEVVPMYNITYPMTSQASVTNTPHIVPTYNIRKSITAQMSVTNTPDVVPSYSITTPMTSQMSVTITPHIVTTFTLPTPISSQMSVANTPHIVPTYNIRKSITAQMSVTNTPDVVPSYNITAPMTSQMSVTNTPHIVPTYNIRNSMISPMPVTNMPEVVPSYNIKAPMTSQLLVTKTPYIVPTNTITKISQMSVTNTPDVVSTNNIRTPITGQMSVTNTPNFVPACNIAIPVTSQMLATKTPQVEPMLTKGTTKSRTKVRQILPSLTISPIMSVGIAPQSVPRYTMTTSRTSQVPSTNAPQASLASPTRSITSPLSLSDSSDIMATLSSMSRGLVPVSTNMNIIGFNDGPESSRDTTQSAVKWLEPGHVEPPSALIINRYASPQEYIAKYGRDVTIVKLDSSKPLWTVSGEYLILAEKILPCKDPTYWTLGSLADCTRLLWTMNKESVGQNKNCTGKKVKEYARRNAPGILVENVVGNYEPRNRPQKTNVFALGNLDNKVTDDSDIISLSDSDDSDDVQIVFDSGVRNVKSKDNGQSRTMLKVKSFAKCERMEKNILEPDSTGNPDIMELSDRYYKKLTDNPPCYSLMLTIVSSTYECDGLLRERAPLHVWDRRTGDLSAIDVSAPPPDQLPPRMTGALLVRHDNSRFLKDMACKFQQLNSANALVRENQVYVFAPKAGTLLVTPPYNLIT